MAFSFSQPSTSQSANHGGTTARQAEHVTWHDDILWWICMASLPTALGGGAESCSAMALSLAITMLLSVPDKAENSATCSSKVSHWWGVHVESPLPLSSTSSTTQQITPTSSSVTKFKKSHESEPDNIADIPHPWLEEWFLKNALRVVPRILSQTWKKHTGKRHLFCHYPYF